MGLQDRLGEQAERLDHMQNIEIGAMGTRQQQRMLQHVRSEQTEIGGVENRADHQASVGGGCVSYSA